MISVRTIGKQDALGCYLRLLSSSVTNPILPDGVESVQHRDRHGAFSALIDEPSKVPAEAVKLYGNQLPAGGSRT
jgi:hypothetical protein